MLPQLLALDIGDKRVGVALASLDTLLAQPLITLPNDQALVDNLKNLVKEHNVKTVIVGLPEKLNGGDSSQTKKIRQTISQLKSALAVEIKTQDEALSSVRAEAELRERGKIFSKADVDKLAACLILEDYINSL